ncbi:MAG: hypothetical protein HY782_04970 [Chloroflexi bacterium]|nr:hypothetical protein [Chloroflexota bacterium]
MRPTRRPLASRDAMTLALYLVLALALTYPLILHFDTHGPGHGVDDPAQTWSIWWFKHAIFNLGTSPLYSDYVFYPLGINLVAYTPTFLNGLISIPLQMATSVIIAQNVVVLFSLVASGWGARLLAREVLARLGVSSESAAIPAAVAGVVYAFGAWHLNYVVAGHFMLLSNEWLPFFALYLIRLEKAPWRNGGLAGLFFVLATWTELTFAPFLAILTGLYVLYLLGRGFTRMNAENKKISALVRARPRPIISNLVALISIAAIGISPLAVNLFLDVQRYGYYLTSGVGRIQVFSAELVSFFFPSAQHPILGDWANGVTQANTSYAFVGYAVLILAGLGVYFYRASREARFWAAAAVFFAVLMLGPTLIVGGESTGVPLPFAALRVIPFVNANRYPVRFNAMLMLALVPLIALGVVTLLRTRRTIPLVGLIGLLAFEQLVLPIPLADLRAPSGLQAIRDTPGDFAVLDLPLGWRGSISLQGRMDDKAQFYQTFHQKRILGGITSRTPQWKFQYFLEAPVINSLIALETEREVDDTRRAQDRAVALDVLRFFNIRYVAANRALASPQLLEYAQDVLPLTEIFRDETRLVYRVAQPFEPMRKIELNGETARLYFDDGWGRGQNGYRWARRGDAEMWLPLAKADQQISFRIMGARAGQAIAVRVNGQVVAELTAAPQWRDYAVRVPAAVVRDGLNTFTFSSATFPIGGAQQDDYAIGNTGVTSPVDIAATGAGFDAGRFGELFVAGRNVVPSQRGYHLVAVNPQSGAVDRVGSFDTFSGPAESARLAQFVEQLPTGEIVAGVAVDEVSRQLQPSAVDALRQLGVDSDLQFQFRAGHAFIGVKGAQPGQALEQVDGRRPASVAVGKNVAGDRVAFALGGIEIRQSGD